ncbi:metalloregulator ArsR/SmtB family transcription factor [Paenibacillus urinalis]|uniref:Metalloregulator ArsR/SmtB family transcription factor n=1 Tax=Paenibacillus urinalis TaxID=521520 RepID=A0AAX3N0E6_9BACL|nr:MULTISPECIES: metalloregulator ArsR/SmtB family transcription factor [Paenibacillus]WDH83171.1 metalloregulator ArsR/SmtB family transcription factor [Paenibacillus urinalis]WDH99252.1 metalloregulator ArsR/SmtB family transcription factor [Paenibacillus urinalis]WDI02945.1 metalloregulator ArsR/SmtB family transcription factor [Paenibacillus urinalis]GAK40447.1 ArsR family transcriptional regulator [Paenibacillus sp. TCA20]
MKEQKTIPVVEECEPTCFGTEAQLDQTKMSLMDKPTSVQMADWFKAFSDPTRLRIIDALLQRELCVHDLTVLLEMGQSAISHQLRSLRNMRIVKRRKEGKTVYYSLDDGHIEQIFIQTLQHIKHE